LEATVIGKQASLNRKKSEKSIEKSWKHCTANTPYGRHFFYFVSPPLLRIAEPSDSILVFLIEISGSRRIADFERAFQNVPAVTDIWGELAAVRLAADFENDPGVNNSRISTIGCSESE
jgi:hypothetical protein